MMNTNYSKRDTNSNSQKHTRPPAQLLISVRCFFSWCEQTENISWKCTFSTLVYSSEWRSHSTSVWEICVIVKKLIYCHTISLSTLNDVLKSLKITHLSNNCDDTAKHTKGDERLWRRRSDFSSLPISPCKSSTTFDEGKSTQPVWRAMLILQLNANNQHR